MTDYTSPGAPASTPYCTFSQKWGDDPFTALGHTQSPNALIEYGARIGLTLSECWMINCILKFKHTADNPYPTQARLAQIVGKDEDTVRRIIKSVEKKGLLVVDKVRGDAGHYTHSVYDFTPLRAALNGAYYADHPQEKPATVQKCMVVQPPCRNVENRAANPTIRAAKVPRTTVQNCVPNKSLKREEKEKGKDAASPPGLFSLPSQEKEPLQPFSGYKAGVAKLKEALDRAPGVAAKKDVKQ